MTFHDLNLNKNLLKAIDELGLTTPTHIQKQAFNVIMSGKDVIGIAQTGTGKTYAYLLPLLRQWKFQKDRFPRILIVVPTRELVVQVVEEVKKLSVFTNLHVVGSYGGVNLKKQAAEIEQGLDLLVSTPGRLLDLCLHGALKLKLIKKFVIDEMDEMLNLGFRPQLLRIMEFLPEKRQNLLFSATITKDVEGIIDQYFNNPQRIEAAPVGTPLENIDQYKYHSINFKTKINLLTHLLSSNSEMSKVLIFVSTKRMADIVFDRIHDTFEDDINIIHSNKSQNYRFNAVNDFTSGKIKYLIATDIIARGIDVSSVTHVVNFDLPETPENYIHRIGRTGRADKKGISISFYTKDELEYLHNIEGLMNHEISVLELPEEVNIIEELEEFEKTVYKMKNIFVKQSFDPEAGGAYHEKKEKNKKENNPIRKAERMRLKYKKPKTRGQKRKKKR